MDSETAAETRLFYNLAGGIGMKALSQAGWRDKGSKGWRDAGS